MKKALTMTLAVSLLLSCAACQVTPESSEAVTDTSSTDAAVESTESTSDPAEDYEYLYQYYATLTPEEIVERLTLEQKAAQMIQPVIDYLDTDADRMGEYCYGSIYGGYGSDMVSWRERLDRYQQMAIESDTGIPYMLGQDDVHGVGYCFDAVYFPHNIGLGAANDEDLMYQMGLITADEARLCHMMWNLYPCVAQSNDPRWGRTYECMSSDLDIITNLSTAYTRGLIDGGVIACAKHFFGDGNVVFGTGETSNGEFRYIDRGDCDLTNEEINDLLAVYQAQIDAGVQTIMVSYTSLNGVKMHEQGDYIWMLKNEMGFEGFIISDYDAIQNTSPATYEEQVINAVNCGIDMFMLSEQYDEARVAIIDGVNNGDITMDRIDDAVTRIIRVKKDAGIFDDPFCEDPTTAENVGSPEYRAVAEQLVEASLVLVKNDNDVLPLAEGTSVYITGPAADNPQAQCGGWTIGWVSSPGRDISGVTTILEAFERYAEDYGIEVITDPEHASEADVVLLCVGEDSYAEWYGDTPDLLLTGMRGLEGNREAIDEAAALGKPTVTCIIAGRNVILDEDDYAVWDSVVMCYL
ncbi:MAG: glycoside hydrolase family 3 C-terminal domain-containing protein, partial [Clostridiales bacterium]|nr:glycoside hydrolase family 3 C-terminal domain-containing protein [Clostridiales bacterium]